MLEPIFKGKEHIYNPPSRPSDWLTLKDGEVLTIFFLDDHDDWAQCYRHRVFDKERGNFVYLICLDPSEGINCPLCASGDRPSYRFFASVFVKESNRPYILSQGSRFRDNFIVKYLKKRAEQGSKKTMCDRWYVLKRYGERQATTYILDEQDTLPPPSEEQRKKYRPFDYGKVLTVRPVEELEKYASQRD